MRVINELVDRLCWFIDDWRTMVIAFVYYILFEATDVVTSVLLNGRTDVHETNPYTRNALHQFLLGRGVGVKLFLLVASLVVGVVLYRLVRSASTNKKLSQLAFAVPFFYFGTDVLLNAVVPNVLLIIRWYQP